MMTRNASLWKTLDWFTIFIYLLLIIAGWFSICGASYDYGNPDFFDLSTRAGKQLLWIVCSFGLSFVLLMLEDSFYNVFAYIIYALIIILLVVTIFIAPDTKGSHSWLILGPISLQPAEFAKFVTALALAKFMNSYSFNMKRLKDVFILGVIILLPMLLIIAQKETGSALVYLAFFLVLYREGMPGVILFSGVCAVFYFIIGIKYGQEYFINEVTPIGTSVALMFIFAIACFMLRAFAKDKTLLRYILLVALGTLVASYLVSEYIVAFNLSWVLLLLCAATITLLFVWSLYVHKKSYFFIGLFAFCSMAFLYSSDYVFNDILKPHQQVRIKVLLGMEEDLMGAGYNVNQSKIAIGSGGLTGKGFLKGTQTKLKYVPEQDTDFIFCTVGEEQGFVGSSLVLLFFLTFILRLIYLSERQPTTFGRVYGYSVVSIFLFHLFINVGMVLGLTPVIGIPLPFFSYGGSSLWGFTFLLFIFLKIDAVRDHRRI